MKTRSRSVFTMVILLTLVGIVPLSASSDSVESAVGAIWYVATDGDDTTGDGSVSSPFATIQHAVDVATAGDVVAVNPGTYTGDGNRDIDPAGKSVVIRSRDDDPLTCIIDCEGSIADPHRGFWFHTSEDQSTVVRGFTITGGGGVGHGGGILIGDPDDFVGLDSAHTRIRNCIIRENAAGFGAGVAAMGAFSGSTAIYDTWILDNDGAGFSSTEIYYYWIHDCHIEGNLGAGIENISIVAGADVAPIQIIRTVVNNNTGVGFNQTMDGDGAGWILVRECEFTNNGGWGVYLTGFPGLVADLDNCRVAGNGGGIFMDLLLGTLENTEVANNEGRGVVFYTGEFPPTVRNVAVVDNAGAGMLVGVNGEADIQSVTCANNQGTGLEIQYVDAWSINIQNCLVAFNQGAGLLFEAVPEFDLACNDVFGNTGGDWDAVPGYLGNDGNIWVDPLFCDPATGNYHLQPSSPCAPGQHPGGDACGLIGALDVGCDLPPVITAIDDVPADQGRQVRLTWTAASADAPDAEPQAVFYAIYRQVNVEQRRPGAADPTGRRIFGWDYIDSVPVRGDESYQYAAPTLCDSTAAGICWSTFFISAVTDDPYVFFDSQPASGYSVDNIVPPPPAAFTVAYGPQNDLEWAASSAPDLAWYDVHRATTSEFEPSPENRVHQTASLAWTDPDGTWGDYYQLVAVDDAGNTSDPVYPDQATPVGDQRPARTELCGNYPNPFNPSTTIAYDLAVDAEVSLRIYDLAGRLVAVAVDGERLTAGRHRIIWNGEDRTGRGAASGTYIYKLIAGGHVESQRMTLVR